MSAPVPGYGDRLLAEVDADWLRRWIDQGIAELLRVTTNEWRYQDWKRRTGASGHDMIGGGA